ncbi:MAG TPA: NAD(P)-binding domain-containing protein [Gammaproteobacteria bacterium]|nr:NAD(P)-binding domain-containing protein [Gammaproteobacteria bacterium]
MPVINSLISLVNKNFLFKNTLFVCVQHLLYTSIDLFDGLISLGANPNNILLMGKIYSTNSMVSRLLTTKGIRVINNLPNYKIGHFQESFNLDILHLWHEVETLLKQRKYQIDHIIVLDDGGSCLKSVPKNLLENYQIIGVEQTSSGLAVLDSVNYPVIEVASSAAKQKVESFMIAKSIEEKLEKNLPLRQMKSPCGVIGLGAIGSAVTEKLLEFGHTVYTFDINKEKNIPIKGAQVMHSIEDTIKFSNYVFGCAGKHVLNGVNLENIIQNDKVFISCSSQDKEFHSLLKKYTEVNRDEINSPLDDLDFIFSDNIHTKILRGGFPINFDGTGSAVSKCDIQMTRGLLFAGLIQATLIVNNHTLKKIPKKIMLCPLLQRFIIQSWKDYGSTYITENSIIKRFNDVTWIEKNSGGRKFGKAIRLFNPILSLIR